MDKEIKEFGTQTHEEIERAITDALITGTGTYVVRGEPVMSKKFREEYQGHKIDWVIIDEYQEIEAKASALGKTAAIKRIAKLAIHLSVRIILVIAVAVTVLAVVS